MDCPSTHPAREVNNFALGFATAAQTGLVESLKSARGKPRGMDLERFNHSEFWILDSPFSAP
jgi:hypothetical protein